MHVCMPAILTHSILLLYNTLSMKSLRCRQCSGETQRWGHTKQGKPRFYCTACKKTSTHKREDVERREVIRDLQTWLKGKDSLSEIAKEEKVTRQAMWKRFQQIGDDALPTPHIPDMTRTRILIVDGTYIHGHTLCALIGIDETDKIYWKFAPYESYNAWVVFLSSFTQPEIIIMDGQKGLMKAAKTLWPKIAVQRCQFHLVAFAMQYIGRRPTEQVSKDLMQILYNLKDAKTHEKKTLWIQSYYAWEKKYEMFISAKNASGKFLRPRLRGARLIIRRAIPYLFTFLDHPGSPNTTNLVEGWINNSIAEKIRLHRGLRVEEKKMLATTILSDLTRKKEKEVKATSVIERLQKAARIRHARFFMKLNAKKKIVVPQNSQLFRYMKDRDF